ncbi:MAG: GNAT family N-acetyltransferase [Christensenellaceae bacterium]|nr:GNAT family N-acetyltransferase [Christensenellaceae bacterium]
MQIVEYFSSKNREYWLSEIKKSDWIAGEYLYRLLSENRFKALVGENSQVFLLEDKGELLAFCTLSEMDDIQPTKLTPWVGFVYTYPPHRNKGYMGLLLTHAEEEAKKQGFHRIHISTGHTGLYEKYGYRFMAIQKDTAGEDSRVYIKDF